MSACPQDVSGGQGSYWKKWAFIALLSALRPEISFYQKWISNDSEVRGRAHYNFSHIKNWIGLLSSRFNSFVSYHSDYADNVLLVQHTSAQYVLVTWKWPDNSNISSMERHFQGAEQTIWITDMTHRCRHLTLSICICVCTICLQRRPFQMPRKVTKQ